MQSVVSFGIKSHKYIFACQVFFVKNRMKITVPVIGSVITDIMLNK